MYSYIKNYVFSTNNKEIIIGYIFMDIINLRILIPTDFSNVFLVFFPAIYILLYIDTITHITYFYQKLIIN